MRIIHIMKDGTVKDSIEGTVIPNGEFYRVLEGIIEKRGVSNKTRKKADSSAEKTATGEETRPFGLVCS